MESQRYELSPRNDGAVSFYKKAFVEVCDNGDKKLFSYDTHVATISVKGELTFESGIYYQEKGNPFWGYVEIEREYLDSQTTRRHINEFLLQNGFNSMSKKEMKKHRDEQYANSE